MNVNVNTIIPDTVQSLDTVSGGYLDTWKAMYVVQYHHLEKYLDAQTI